MKESELYDYPVMQARLYLLRRALADLSSLSAQSYDALGGRGGDPVARRTERALDLERRIAAAEARTRPTEALLAWLDGGGEELRQMGEVLRRKYFQCQSWEEMRRGMHLSRTTLHRRIRSLRGFIRKWE